MSDSSLLPSVHHLYSPRIRLFHFLFTFKHRFVPAHPSQSAGLRIPGNTCWRYLCLYETNHHIELLVYILDYTWLHTRLDDTSELAISLPSNSTWRTFFHNSNPQIALQRSFLYALVTTSTLHRLCTGSASDCCIAYKSARCTSARIL